MEGRLRSFLSCGALVSGIEVVMLRGEIVEAGDRLVCRPSEDETLGRTLVPG